MPDDIAEEKVKALLALGADVERVRPASIVDKKQVRSSLVIAYFPPHKYRLVVCCGYPRNFVSWRCFHPFLSQNLARQRAAHFGQNRDLRPHIMRTSTSSIVVATTASEDLLDDPHGAFTIEEEAELRTRRRGFFADQFEVYLSGVRGQKSLGLTKVLFEEPK